MAKKVYLKERGASLNLKGVGVINGEIPYERYEKIIADYPQLESQFEVVEETPVKAKTETAKA